MKLITEYNHIVEAKTDSKGTYIEGVFMQANQKNRNGRIYEKPLLEKAVTDYVESQVSKGRAVGELNHPDSPTVNYKEASHRILSLEWQGDNVVGKALILNTPNGQIVKGLLEGGVQLGVSSRGMGSLRTVEGVDYVADDFVLNTIDIVQDPSAPNAFVNGIMEGVEWKRNDKGLWESIKTNETNNKCETELIAEGDKLKAAKKLLSRLI